MTEDRPIEPFEVLRLCLDSENEVATDYSLGLILQEMTPHLFELGGAQSYILLDRVRQLNLVSQSMKSLDPPWTSVEVGAESILLVSYHVPTIKHAGGLRIIDIYSILKRFHPDIKLDLYTIADEEQILDEAVLELFDAVYVSNCGELSHKEFVELSSPSNYYDLIDFQFHHSLNDFENLVRLGDRTTFTIMECLSLSFRNKVRQEYEEKSAFSIPAFVDFLHWANQEIRISSKIDQIVCVSRSDQDFLAEIGVQSELLETGISECQFHSSLEADSKSRAIDKSPIVIFVASFESATNVEALLWYLRLVHPKIKKHVCGYKLQVVGKGNLDPFKDFEDADLELVGEVDRVEGYIKQAKLGIAPALTGAGFRGKINQYSIFGVPTVASELAAEGLKYVPLESIMIAENESSFADYCIRLLTDDRLNDRIASTAQQVCEDNYLWSSKYGDLCRLYGIKNRVPTFWSRLKGACSLKKVFSRASS